MISYMLNNHAQINLHYFDSNPPISLFLKENVIYHEKGRPFI